VYSPLGAVVSPPSEYLWKTLTYWSRQCLTAPSPSGCSWIKCGKNFYGSSTISHVLNSRVTEPNLTKISRKVKNWWPKNTLKSEFQYSNSFSNASMTNKRRSSNWRRVAVQFPFVSLFSAETTGPIFTEIVHDIYGISALVALLNHADTCVSAFRFRTPQQRVKGVNFDVCQNAPKLIGYHSNVPWDTAKLIQVS